LLYFHCVKGLHNIHKAILCLGTLGNDVDELAFGLH